MNDSEGWPMRRGKMFLQIFLEPLKYIFLFVYQILSETFAAPERCTNTFFECFIHLVRLLFSPDDGVTSSGRVHWAPLGPYS